MTTKKTAGFWAEVQAFTASHYALQHAQIITNSDGGQGYTADKFQEAFSQSNYPVFNQLDSYHIFQGLNRAFGSQTILFKQKVNQALKTHDLNELTIWLDTYESTLDETPAVEKLTTFRTYVLRNWDRIFDWREKVEQVPQDARGLGAMESNQRHISFRMKKRGMHWSEEGCEAMVKVKQGILNHTLRDAYLHQQSRSTRQQRKRNKRFVYRRYCIRRHVSRLVQRMGQCRCMLLIHRQWGNSLKVFVNSCLFEEGSLF